MTDFLSQEFFMNSVSQWLIALLYILGGIVIAKITYYIFKKVLKGYTSTSRLKFDDIIVDTVEKPVIFGIAIFGFYLAMQQLNKSEVITDTVGKGYKFLIVIGITWFVVRFVNTLVEQYMQPGIKETQSNFDNQVLPILKKIIAVAIWIMGTIIAFNAIGYNLAGLIAGLGIGGLAFALAAKDYIQNIFGGVSIFTDKPFKINDRVRVDGFDGKVEEIGIRSSRIRTLSGSLVTIPNSKFISNSVENVALEPTRKIVLKLGLTYDTTADQIETSMALLKQITTENQELVTEESIVFFETFGDFSLVVNFIYYIRKNADIPTAQNAINLAILRKYSEAKLDFAFPTQTIHAVTSK